VAVDPLGVTIGTEVSVAGTETVVVPPETVRTLETELDGATETEVVDPCESTTETELTDSMDELMNDETETGTVTTEPLSVVMTSVTYGVLDPGVETVVYPPFEVVTTTVSGVGMWRVADPPLEVSTVTELSHSGMVRVAVLPSTVMTLETIGLETVWMVMVESDESTMERVATGVEVNAEAETDVTVTPDSVMTGVDDAGAGVYTVVVAPDGVV
jgi:hypothetical protein